MKFIIEGMRNSGKEVKYSLDDYNVARFEYGCLKDVCSYVVLYQQKGDRLQQLDLHIDN
ncbi:MAG: hypothetical protein ACRC18_06665 [Cetobacterium sp.]